MVGRDHSSQRSVWLVCLTASFVGSLFMIVLDLAVPTIATEFGCSVELAIWASLAPMFVDSMLGPTMGRIADTFGHRRVWLSGMLLEAVQCLLSGLAPTIWLLLLARPLAGLSNSPARSAGFSMMCRDIPPSKRGFISSLQTTVGTLAASLGLAGSGFLIDLFGWRALFLGPVLPVCILLCAGYCVLPPHGNDSSQNEDSDVKTKAAPVLFDWAGAVLLALIVGCVLVFFNRGNALGWRSPILAALLGVIAVATPVFVYVEKKAVQPVLPGLIFCHRTRGAVIVIYCLNNACWVTGSFILPLFLQRAKGLSVGTTGLLLFMRPAGGFLTSLAMARVLSHDGYIPHRQIVQVGLMVTATAYALLLLIEDADMNSYLGLGLVILSQSLQCIGGVVSFLMCQSILMASVPKDSLSTTNGMLGTLSSCFYSTSMALMTAIVHLGDETDVRSYRPVWIIVTVIQLPLLATTMLIQNDGDETEKGSKSKQKYVPLPRGEDGEDGEEEEIKAPT